MFFTAIHQMMTESVDLTIVIRKTNGQLTVSTLPKSNGLKAYFLLQLHSYQA